MKKIICCIAALAAGVTAFASEIIFSNNKVPVLDKADVVVVGGTAAGAEAAISAAKSGVRVFLISERTFVGEDICSTYRLWLEPGEQPLTALAKEIFTPEPVSIPTIGRSLPFSYKASKPSAKLHPDTPQPSVLTDGKWKSAAKESVQYDDNVEIDIYLEKPHPVNKVHVLAYQRVGDFEVDKVSVLYEPLNTTGKLTPLTEVKNPESGNGNYENNAIIISAEFKPVQTKHLRLLITKPQNIKRILLGEIVVEEESNQKSPDKQNSVIALVKPMQVKRTLDEALINAGVQFIFASFPVQIINDESGQPCGVIIVNRSGKQAVLGKVLIDATMNGVLTRLVGAQLSPYPAGTREFKRVVVGGQIMKSDSLSLVAREQQLIAIGKQGITYPVHEYKIQIQIPEYSISAFQKAEQFARDLTWNKEVADSSEILFEVPPQQIRAQSYYDGAWQGADKIPVGCFKPEGLSNFYTLNGYAGVSRQTAEYLMRPVNIMAVGERIGKVAADQAKQAGSIAGIKADKKAKTANAIAGEIRFADGAAWHRLPRSGDLDCGDGSMPVLGTYDVVVVGGGTGGAPAAIAAGRMGAKTLLIEYLYTLGGVGTAGLISSYYHGNRVGFTKEVDAGVAEMGGSENPSSSAWNPEIKSEWYRKELRKAGVDIWYGSFGAGAFVEKNTVRGVVVSTPWGTGIVLAKVIIDSTGNADIAAAAGATCRYTDDTEVAVQGTGLPPKELGARYTNTDYTFVDDTDILDIWRVFVTARQKFRSSYDLGQLIDTRERRQIVGEAFLTPMDMMLNRTHPDTIVIAKSNFDTHGYTIHPIFTIRPPHRDDIYVHVPYRCLLPKGIEGIIVTGLGISAHRDALPVIRMQADIQNQGYAAGVAAAMISKQNITTRELNIKELQKQLVKIGNLPESVLTEKDNFPLPQEEIIKAVRELTNNYEKLEVALAFPEQSIPLMEKYMAQVKQPSHKLIYAHILAMLGNNSGLDILLEKIKNTPWDKGWRYTGMGQFGASMSPLDSYIIAAGRTRDKRALDVILQKAEQLDSTSEFSHFRAIALALEYIGDPKACPTLAKLLKKPGISGNAITDIKTAILKNPQSATDTSMRNDALTELVLARALYRCGDYKDIGKKILAEYARDLHGHYARHASAVLNAGK
jgi:flavin-dependent dehydrogenase